MAAETVDALLRQAIEAIQAGDRATGRRLLAQVLRHQPDHEEAWLWLALAVDSEERRRDCLRQVLRLNPDNPVAQLELEATELALTTTPLVAASPDLAPDAPTQPDSLVSAAAPQPRSVSDGLPCCEVCGRALGLELLDCPERARGGCPYRVERSSPAKMASVNLARRDTLYNPATGQMWEEIRSLDAQWTQTTTPFQPLSLPAQALDTMQYPASVNALYRNNDKKRRSTAEWIAYASGVFQAALVSLVAQGVLRLQHTLLTSSREEEPRRHFVLGLGANPQLPRISGELEQTIVQTVFAWSKRTNPGIRLERHGHTQLIARKLRHCLTLHDALIVILEGDQANPGHWLIARVVAPNAVHLGLGRVRGLLSRRFELDAQQQQLLEDDYQAVRRLMDAFATDQPYLAADLRQCIQEALEARINTRG